MYVMMPIFIICVALSLNIIGKINSKTGYEVFINYN